VILLTAVVVGFILTYARAKLTHRQLRSIELEIPWLVFFAVIPQWLLFQMPAVGKYIADDIVPIIMIGSQTLLLVFVLVNLKQPGVWALTLGLVMNLLAIVTNRGWMPISPETVRQILPTLPADFPLVDRRLGLSKDWIIPTSEINLPWLADRFTLPGWIPYQVAFSIGDVFIAIGAFLLLWSLSSSKHGR
jgi:hypothetical protein